MTLNPSLVLARAIAGAPTQSELKPAQSVAGNPVLHRSARTVAVNVRVDETIALARTVVILDAIANTAADLVAATDAEGAAVLERLMQQLTQAGYLTLIDTEEDSDGNAE